MKTSMYIMIAVVVLMAASAHKQVTPALIQKTDYEKERTEI
jgi:hypothetical protein